MNPKHVELCPLARQPVGGQYVVPDPPVGELAEPRWRAHERVPPSFVVSDELVS